MKSFTAIAIASLLALASAAPASHAHHHAHRAFAVIHAANGTTTTGTGASNSTTGGTTGGTNIQVFTGALGGPPPPVLQTADSKRPFSVNGDTFVGKAAALGRSCDVQHNACADDANGGAFDGGVGQCDDQNAACHAANGL